MYVLAAILAVGVVSTYANHFHNGFHFDDSHTIINNVYIRNIRNIPSFFLDSTKSSAHPPNQTYRPIVTASTAIDYWLGKGLTPLYFHLSVFTLFLLQGVLMYFLFLHVFNLAFKDELNKYAALFAVAWYLLHPANAETINYMLARSDSISTLFIILTFVAYFYFPLCRKWHLYLVPLALGGLTKQLAIMFGPLLVVYLLLFEGKVYLGRLFGIENRAQLASSVRIAAAALVFCVLLFVFGRYMDSGTWVFGGPSRYNYFITQPYVVLQYFTTFFLPISLSADTDLAPLTTMLDARFLVGIVFVAGMFFTAIRLSKNERFYPVSFGILWFFIALIPTSTVIPLAEVMNDHRLFFPYVGLMMAVVWGITLQLYRLRQSFPAPWLGRAAAFCAVIMLAVYGYGTHSRNEVWRTEETLWRDVTLKSPKNGRGWMNYGLTQMAKGAYPAAEAAYLKALEFVPRYSVIYINLGVLNAATGKFAEAEAYYLKALELGAGTDQSAYSYYGRFLVQQKRLGEGLPLLLRALQLAPADIDNRYQLMIAYEQGGDFAALRAMAEETLRIDPNDAASRSVLAALDARQANPGQQQYGSIFEQTPEALLNLSLQKYLSGDFNACIKAAEAALRLRPDYAPAYNNICAAWNSLGKWRQAVAAGERAVALDPANELARNNLALAKSRAAAQP